MLNFAIDLFESLKQTLDIERENIVKATLCLVNSLKSGNKILVCGNGGSAAEAQHFVAELVVRFKLERKSIPAISLTTDSSILTACSNDYSFSEVFSRQIEGLAKKGDVLLCLTTSGNSENLLKAAKKAKELDCKVISFTGNKQNRLEDLSDITVKVKSENTARIQEIQLFLIHQLAEEIEEKLK